MVPLTVISFLIAFSSALLGFSFMSGSGAIVAQTLFVVSLTVGMVALLADAVRYHNHHRPA